jgi:predicted unusual protein kinase regulating ubiquinone biosynthesis (AarF/ABC1/UbiB family)
MRKVHKLSNSEKESDRLKIKKLARKNLDLIIRLGPTFIKLGQILSARADMFPQEYIDVMSELQDLVPPAPFEEIEKELKEELGPNFNTIFTNFEKEPLQSASLGQVHRAELKGKTVAVKILRPDIKKRVILDLYSMKMILPWYRFLVGSDFAFSMNLVIDHIQNTVFEEMNYKLESQNLKDIKEYVSYDPKVRVPNVYDEYVTEKVLPMEYLPGIKITNVTAIKNAGIDCKDLAKRIVYIFSEMVLLRPKFHADPHPGNLSVLNDGTLILYDFGMVGKLLKEVRGKLFYLYYALFNKDADSIINGMIDIGALDPYADKEIIKKGISLAFKSLEGKTVDEYEIKDLVKAANSVIIKFPFRLPNDLVMFIRMYALMESVVLTLDPEFNMIESLGELFKRTGLRSELVNYMVDREFNRVISSISSLLDTPTNINTYIDSKLAKEHSKKRPAIEYAIAGSGVLIASSLLFYISYKYFIIGAVVSVFLFLLSFRSKN